MEILNSLITLDNCSSPIQKIGILLKQSSNVQINKNVDGSKKLEKNQ